MLERADVSKERFISISESRLKSIAGLSLKTWKLYVLLTTMITRKRNREPTEKTNPFILKYRDFKEYGISRPNFTRGIKELIENNIIRVEGQRQKRFCELLKW
jgi:hypothetical protein